MSLSFLEIIDDTTCDGVEYSREVPDGWLLLYRAINLWNLVDSPKGQALFQLLKSELEVPRADGLLVMTLPQVQYVRDLFQDIEHDLEPLLDTDWHILPEFVERVIQQVPDAVDVWSKDDHPIYSLANTMFKLLGVRFFLTGALCLHMEVELGG